MSEIDEEQIEKLIEEEIVTRTEANREFIKDTERGVLEKIEETSSIFSLREFLKGRKVAYGLASALLLLLGVALGAGLQALRQAGAPPLDTEAGLEFVIAYPEAEEVSLVGDFTNWEPRPLERQDGVWIGRVELKPGRYEYNFVVDGREWVLDPRADEYARSFDDFNSVVYIGGEGR